MKRFFSIAFLLLGLVFAKDSFCNSFFEDGAVGKTTQGLKVIDGTAWGLETDGSESFSIAFYGGRISGAGPCSSFFASYFAGYPESRFIGPISKSEPVSCGIKALSKESEVLSRLRETTNLFFSSGRLVLVGRSGVLLTFFPK